MIRKKFEVCYKLYSDVMKALNYPVLGDDVCWSIFEAGANAQLEIDQEEMHQLAKGE